MTYKVAKHTVIFAPNDLHYIKIYFAHGNGKNKILEIKHCQAMQWMEYKNLTNFCFRLNYQII